MKKALKFVNRYGSEQAQRDNIRYSVKHSMWHEGKATALPYHVVICDLTDSASYDSTENTRRFASSGDAKQFCQDIYEGIISLSEIQEEIRKEDAARKEKVFKEDDAVKAFKDLLRKKGITISDYLEINISFNTMKNSAREMLFDQSREGRNE